MEAVGPAVRQGLVIWLPKVQDYPCAFRRRRPGQCVTHPGRLSSDIVGCVNNFRAELIEAAQAVLRPHRTGDRLFGDVAAVLVTEAGHRFAGVSIDTGSGTGFCAEHSAIAAMVTAGEYRIAAIVAVWRDEKTSLYVLPPCGRCREFMRQVDSANLDTTVLLQGGRSALVRDLLPEYSWPEPEAEETA